MARRNTIIVGTVAMTEAAKKRAPGGGVCTDEVGQPHGSVKCDGVLIIVIAAGNSSQAALKVNIETTASAGTDKRHDQAADHPQGPGPLQPERLFVLAGDRPGKSRAGKRS